MSRLFNGSSDVIEVIIKDMSGSKLDKRMANLSDKKAVGRIFRWLNTKYGLSLDVDKVDEGLEDFPNSEFLRF